jgi:hypothetical protein
MSVFGKGNKFQQENGEPVGIMEQEGGSERD